MARLLFWFYRACCPLNRLHGLEENVEVCIFYVESWLRGNGCIPVNFKMEDAATAEISRAQVSIPAPRPQAPSLTSSKYQLNAQVIRPLPDVH